MPLLAIVTINKNNEQGVLRTIASLQPVRNNDEIQLIFVDGGSTDSSLSIAKPFYSSGQLVSAPGTGIYAAMNRGFSLSCSDWVLWINSGDEFLSGCWERLRQELISSDYSVICGAAEIIDEQTGKVVFVKQSNPVDLPWFMVNHSSSVFRCSVFSYYGMYSESYLIAADRCMMVTLFLAGEKISYTELCISRFWLGGISDLKQLLRAKENLQIDFEAGLISTSAYQYALFREFSYHRIVKPVVFSLRQAVAKLGYQIPPLGKYAGFFGELPRNIFDK